MRNYFSATSFVFKWGRGVVYDFFFIDNDRLILQDQIKKNESELIKLVYFKPKRFEISYNENLGQIMWEESTVRDDVRINKNSIWQNN